MMNVLFALDNPVECLTEVRRVLKYGGVLSLSTSRNSTNIHKLFGKIKEEIEDLRKWEEKKDLYKSAYDRNIEMEPIVVRYSEGDIRRYIERAGFEIEAQSPPLYVDCVLVYKAVKKKKPVVRLMDEPG